MFSQVFHYTVSWALEATKGVQIPKQNQGLPFQLPLQHIECFLLSFSYNPIVIVANLVVS
jgi:hypothetical protein